MNIKFKSKKYVIALLVVGITLLLSLVLSGTYALWTMTDKQTGSNKIIGGCLIFSMEDQGEGITLENSFPITDFEGMQLEGYTFTVTNNCPDPVDYRIELNSLVEESGNYMGNEYVATLLDYGVKTSLSELESLEYTSTEIREKHTLAYDTVMGKNTNKHTLRLWVDESATTEEQNKSFLSQVSVIAGQGIEKYYTPGECFTFDSSSGTITSYDETCGGTDVVIPYQFNVEGVDEPVAVTTIGNAAFRGTSSVKSGAITSVEFPRSVTRILGSAFLYNTNLEKIIFKDGLESISNAAFMNSAGNVGKLSFVMFPETLTTIQQAFPYNSLEQIVIPDSVTTLTNSFRNNKIKKYKIGSGVTNIGNEVFKDNEIKELVIPETVQTIGGYAFYGNKIKEVNIHNNITKINQYAFYNNDIENVIIGDGVEIIGDSAFTLNPIKTLSLGTGLTTIEAEAFSNMHTDLASDEFEPNYLTEVIIPSNVVSIGDLAFYSMTTGTKIIVKNDEENMTLGNSWSGQATVVYEPETTETTE